MDICMPVMDGLEVTKLVRTFERTGKWEDEGMILGDPAVVISPRPPAADSWPGNSTGTETTSSGGATDDLVDQSNTRGNAEKVGGGGSGGGLTGAAIPHLPIVAMTANALADCESQCSAQGMDGFITKPITFKKLADAIQVFLEQEVRL